MFFCLKRAVSVSVGCQACSRVQRVTVPQCLARAGVEPAQYRSQVSSLHSAEPLDAGAGLALQLCHVTFLGALKRIFMLYGDILCPWLHCAGANLSSSRSLMAVCKLGHLRGMNHIILQSPLIYISKPTATPCTYITRTKSIGWRSKCRFIIGIHLLTVFFHGYTNYD